MDTDVSTDASEKFWAGVVTQTTKDQYCKGKEKQQHKTLGFLDGKLVSAQNNGQPMRKKRTPIVKGFDRMHYVLQGENCAYKYAQIIETYDRCSHQCHCDRIPGGLYNLKHTSEKFSCPVLTYGLLKLMEIRTVKQTY